MDIIPKRIVLTLAGRLRPLRVASVRSREEILTEPAMLRQCPLPRMANPAFGGHSDRVAGTRLEALAYGGVGISN